MVSSAPGAARAAQAKINLFLHVGERRTDGFHPLQSLAVFTDFGDRLAVENADDLSLAIDEPFAAALTDGDNLALKAARALAAKAYRSTQLQTLYCRRQFRIKKSGQDHQMASPALKIL